MASSAPKLQPPPGVTPRQRAINRWGVLKSQRASWDTHWEEIGQNFRPRRPRFNWKDNRNKAASIRNDKLVNNTPIIASRTLSAGMQGGLTSPSRPWFLLTVPDRQLAESRAVKEWLHSSQEAMRLAFARSNIYSALQTFYADLGDFGTAVMWIDEDDEDLLRAYTIPVGQYALANSQRLSVDSLYRVIPMTVGQMVDRFGLQKCSTSVQNEFRQNRVDVERLVLHLVEPKSVWYPGGLGVSGMQYRSCWMEYEGDANTGFLLESGYYDRPFLAARWETTAEDVYGSSPGMDALGDAKALQQLEADKLVMVEKLVNPPLTAPTMMQNQPVSMVPGKVTYVDAARAGQQTIEPIHKVEPLGVQVAGVEIQRHEQRIDRTYFRDLFLATLEAESRQVTAREIAERHEE
ncbi:MAG: portal protein, partial [Pyrinomonadaceae bacterium]